MRDEAVTAPKLNQPWGTARAEIDGHLVYRLLKPLYNAYPHLGIHQRDLQTFEQPPDGAIFRFTRSAATSMRWT